MSENKNSFDDLIRSKLNVEEEPVSAGMWNAIEKELPVNTGKKRFAFWKLALLLLLISIPVSVFYLADDSNFVKQETNTASNEPSTVSKPNNVPSVSFSLKNTEALPEAKSSDAAKAEQIIQPINSQLPYNHPVKEKKIIRTKKHSAKTDLSITIAPVKATPDSGNEQLDEGTSNNSANVDNAIENTNTTAIATATEPQTIIETGNATLVALTDSSKALIKPESVKIDSLIPQILKNKNWFIEIFYSPDYANKSMTLNGDDESYLRIRKNTEQYFYAHSYGIRAGYKLSEKLRVKIGLDYTVIQNRLSYGYLPGQNGAPAGLKTDSVTGIIINPLNSGIIITGKDTTVANYELVGENSEINEYKFYNIPLIVSYSLGKKKIKCEAGAGVFLNISSKQTGSIIGVDRISRINLKEDKQRTPYKTKAGIGITTEILMTYSISPNIKFLLGPHAKFYLSKLNKSNATVNEKLFNAGIFTGFRVEF